MCSECSDTCNQCWNSGTVPIFVICSIWYDEPMGIGSKAKVELNEGLRDNILGPGHLGLSEWSRSLCFSAGWAQSSLSFLDNFASKLRAAHDVCVPAGSWDVFFSALVVLFSVAGVIFFFLDCTPLYSNSQASVACLSVSHDWCLLFIFISLPWNPWRPTRLVWESVLLWFSSHFSSLRICDVAAGGGEAFHAS